MGLKVTVVGVGLVGEAIVSCLKERKFPCEWPPRVAATRERPETLAGEKMLVEETGPKSFEGANIVLFAGQEGAKGASVTWRETAEKCGAWSIDNGRDFRMAADVPLVVPEVNSDAITPKTRFIASPNCSTIQMVVAMAPIHRAVGIKRIVVATYQATSGWGMRGPQELRAQLPVALERGVENLPYDPKVFNRPIAFNCIPHIDMFVEGDYTREEMKMVNETRKILGDQKILVSATTVRVPVLNGHSEAVWVETKKKLSAADARELLRAAPGVVVMDEPDGENKRTYPTPLDLVRPEYKDMTLVGRIREDTSTKNGLAMWVVADNIRKGAALNVVQIAEELLRRGYLKA